MFAIFILLRKVFLKTARDIKRIEAISECKLPTFSTTKCSSFSQTSARSPMFTHTTATLEGLSTIRAFKAEKQLTHEYDQHQNLNSSAWFLFVATSREKYWESA
jgi:ATP-binding cassette, subfamily C (CFTR/MRP), member 4